jgi:ribosome-binding factor A
MLKKIMAGREKGKRRFVYNENLPKMENVKKLSDAKGQGKESARRITVLNKLFMKNITDLMATDAFSKGLAGYGIQVRSSRVFKVKHCATVFLF